MTATVLFGVAVGLGAPAPKDKERAPAIVGEWVVESVKSNGKSLGRGGGLRCTFTPDGQWVIQQDGKKAPIPGGGTRTYSVDPPAVDLFVGQPAGVAAPC